ncbi:MAG: hypothetical protein LC746_01175 [Acidobacteria bacterium]|nr:hypothetical protein [Acidobacteriota bacterium]
MTRFAKKETCPSSHTLSGYASDALPPLARRTADAHLRACDFCAAEVRLLARAVAPAGSTAEAADVPPLPLALRLFAESRLAEVNAPSSVKVAA